MAPEAVARALAAEPRTLHEDGRRLDQFLEIGFSVSYGAGDGTVEHVDTAEPAELEHNGLVIAAGQPLAQALVALETRGEQVVRIAPDLWIAPRLGASIWAPADRIETAGAFGHPDYYE